MKRRYVLFPMIYLIFIFFDYQIRYIAYHQNIVPLMYICEFNKFAYYLFILVELSYIFAHFKVLTYKEYIIFIISLFIILILHIPFYKMYTDMTITHDFPTLITMIIISMISLMIKKLKNSV